MIQSFISVSAVTTEAGRILHGSQTTTDYFLFSLLHFTNKPIWNLKSKDVVLFKPETGNSDSQGTELLENLLMMVSSKEEQQDLRELKDDFPIKLRMPQGRGQYNIAFSKLEVMLYVGNFGLELIFQ